MAELNRVPVTSKFDLLQHVLYLKRTLYCASQKADQRFRPTALRLAHHADATFLTGTDALNPEPQPHLATAIAAQLHEALYDFGFTVQLGTGLPYGVAEDEYVPEVEAKYLLDWMNMVLLKPISAWHKLSGASMNMLFRSLYASALTIVVSPDFDKPQPHDVAGLMANMLRGGTNLSHCLRDPDPRDHWDPLSFTSVISEPITAALTRFPITVTKPDVVTVNV